VRSGDPPNWTPKPDTSKISLYETCILEQCRFEDTIADISPWDLNALQICTDEPGACLGMLNEVEKLFLEHSSLLNSFF
jgi:hypothetical protein